jgi:serine/threonine-protein kinase
LSAHKVGSVLDGKYEILERLGAGGMGEVFRVRHVHLHEQRVIKILRQDRAADPTAIQRFSQEARIATQIKHPNVAILYDFSRLDDGSFYMVWEHIEGEDVGTWLRAKGPFPLQLAVELGIQGLRGLEAIHAAGVIHRDISPDNLMITRDVKGRALLKIIDLGLAKNLAAGSGNLEITQAGMFMGKLMYCSPEQAGSLKEGTIDHRSDLYSYGAVLYEMLCGLPPFDSENEHGFVFKRLSEDPLPLATRNPKVRVPEELEKVVRRALARDREARYPDAPAFLHGLARVADLLRQVATQELPALGVTSSSKRQAPRPTTPLPGTPVVSAAAAPPAAAAPARPVTRELSREERLDLLAQIDRAATAARLLERAEAALKAGKIDEARTLAARLEAANPRHQGLADLKRALADLGQTHERAQRERRMAEFGARFEAALAADELDEAAALVAEAEGEVGEMPALAAARARVEAAREGREREGQLRETEVLLGKYIKERKQALARLALDSLLELSPAHPKRADYETWVEMIGREAAEMEQAERLLEAGREALAAGDLRGARRQLDALSRIDPGGEVAGRLSGEVDEAERRDRRDSELATLRTRLEEALEARRLDEAERQLERLAGLGLPRVAVASYRTRLDEARQQQAAEGRATAFERRYREAIAAKDWTAARGVASEYGDTLPASPRPGAMFAEVMRLEEIQHRQQGTEQGARQLEELLAAGRLAEAELTLKVLLQLDPSHPRRLAWERRIAELRAR